jgi:hypothetical protein
MKAFMHQDHDAHIKVHMSMINDPLVQQLVGQNPKAQQMQAAMMAHIAEHVGYAYRQKIEQQLGMPLPPEDEKLPPEIELALSTMMAQAANQVLQQSQAQAAQAQAQQQAQDPVSENRAMLRCEPMKAFMHQDHDSHIKVHMSMINDPLVQQLVGQNPKAAQMQGAMMAHIAEHVGYLYRQKIEQQLGLPLPPEDEKLPPEIELALSGMMAQAANQVLQQSQGQAAQAQAQQQAQDPVLQMQQQELAIKQGELALKQKKIIADAAAQADRLKLDEKKMMIDAADKADRNRAAQGEDPRVAQARAQQEMSANESRQQQELAAMQSRTVMAAQQHNQNLTHKQQVHRQNLEHQREQAAIRAELARNKTEGNPNK